MELEDETITGSFGAAHATEPVSRKEGYSQDGMIDPDYQEEIRPLLENGDKKNYAWNTVDLLGHLLLCPCPIVNVKVKL